jgi:hypothetical protein
MINSQMFEIVSGKDLRHIIEVKHEELGQRINESKPKSESWTQYVGYNNCLKVLENEIKRIKDDDVVCVTEDLESYEKNVGAAKPILSMFYVKLTACSPKDDVRLFIVYFAKY